MVNEKSAKRRRGTRKDKKQQHNQDPWTKDGFGVMTYKPHDALLIKLDGKTWFDCEKSLVGFDTKMVAEHKVEKAMSDDLAATYRSMANEIYRREVQLFAGGSGSGNGKWVEGTIRKGTLKDRIAAMSVIISHDPLHKFHAIDGLLQMTGGSTDDGGGQTNSRVAQLAAEALEDLFLNTLLPADRKLCSLNQRALPVIDTSKTGKSALTMSPRILLLWRFEEMVKEKFNIFIRNYLGKTLREGLEITKVAALRTASTLLRSVPEGEAAILGMLTNKLGDPSKKTAAAAGHELRKVLQEHPNMQLVIAREVQQLAHRPHLSSRALYNCITFLNQLKLERSLVKKGASSPLESSLPGELICTYFKLFKVVIRATQGRGATPGSGVQTRLLSALLAGVNRAHPYLPMEDQKLEDHVDELYRVIHTAPAATATQALTLLFHIIIGSPTKGKESVVDVTEESVRRQDRYYRALFAALATPSMTMGKHATMFFNILYKSMKADNDTTRVLVIAKRMLATTMHCNSPAFAASIFVLNEVASHHEPLRVYLEQIPDESLAGVVLDPSKREPKAALWVHNDESNRAPPKNASSWELALASSHYHPSVAKFSSTVGAIFYNGNPLQDFSLAPFLDKFAYRNPRDVKRAANKICRGESVGERRSTREEAIGSRLILPVNDPSFLKQRETDVQDQFFKTFFMERAKRVGTHDKSKKKEMEMDEDDALDAAEQNDFDHTYKQFESQWESDSDEEKFVDELALKMLEDQAEGVPVDVDEEPDIDGWDNLSSYNDDGTSESRINKDSDESSDDYDDERHGIGRVGEAGHEAFMDEDDSSEKSSKEESDEEQERSGKKARR